MTDLTGQTFGQYEIIERIGLGKADVYRAKQESPEREVAVKVLPAPLLQDDTFLERFTGAMQTVAELEHPRLLVPIYESGVQDGLPFVAMAYMPGGSLADLIQATEGGLPFREVARLVEQIAEGLDFVHSKGIIHYNLKPSNVLLDEDGNAHLSDLGIAKVVAETSQDTDSRLIGAPAYVSPEMAEQATVTPLVDVYALGVMLFEMLTGQQPFAGSTPMGILLAHLNEPVPDARELRPGLPDEVQVVIERAMAKEPKDRYQSASELAADLHDAIKLARDEQPVEPTLKGVTPPSAGLPTAVQPPPGVRPPPPATPPTPPARRGPPPWVWAIGGAVLGMAIITIVYMLAGVLSFQVEPTPEVAEVEPTATTPPPTETSTPTAGPSPTPTLTLTPTDTPAPTLTPTPTLMGGSMGLMALVSERDGDPEIFVLDPSTDQLTQMTFNTGLDGWPVWSPDGTRLAYHAEDEDGWWHIYVVAVPGGWDVDAEDPVRLTSGFQDHQNPAWLPDGQSVAYVINDGGDWSIARSTLGGAEAQVTALPPMWMMLLDWSPEDVMTLYGFSAEGDIEIMTLEVGAEARERAAITNVRGDIDFASYSPDHSKVVYTALINDQHRLFIADTNCPMINECNVRQLIADEFNYYTPRFSPDGTLILVTSDRGGNRDLWVMDLNGENLQQITDSHFNEYDGVWQPGP